jgi:hypothetical protein
MIGITEEAARLKFKEEEVKKDEYNKGIVANWKQTGLLKDCKSERQEILIAHALENQKRELLRNQEILTSEIVENVLEAVPAVFNRIYEEYSCVRFVTLPANVHFYKDYEYKILGGDLELVIASRAFVVHHPFDYHMTFKDSLLPDFAERAYQRTKIFLDNHFKDESDTLYIYIPFCCQFKAINQFSFRGAVCKDHAL